MTRLMYDSVTAVSIPSTAAMVAGYVDGRYRWSTADWARFPAAVKVGIAVFPSTNDGHVLDCETGDATPAQCPGWVQMRRAAGVDPTVYCNFATWGAVHAAFVAARVPGPHYWIAGYSKPVDTSIPPGAVARQYTDAGPYDLSNVADYWPGVDPVPVVKPTAEAATTVNDYPTFGGPMPSFVAVIPVGANGEGWAVYDGGINSDPGSASLSPAVPWPKFVAATPWCVDPAHDTDRASANVGVQVRGGWLFVRASGSAPGNTAVAYITYTP